MFLLRLVLFSVLFVIAGGLALPARAAGVILVLSEESSAFSEAAEALTAELRSAGHRPQTLTVPLRADDAAALSSTPLIVTLGTPRRASRVRPRPAHPRAAHPPAPQRL